VIIGLFLSNFAVSQSNTHSKNHFNFNQSEYGDKELYELSGTWGFINSNFVKSENFDELQKLYQKIPNIKVPGNWSKHILGGRLGAPSTGYGTFITKVNFKQNSDDTYLFIEEWLGAYEIYTLDKSNKLNLVGTMGKLHKTYSPSKISREKKPFHLGEVSTGDLFVLINYSGYMSSHNGPKGKIFLGSSEAVKHHYSRSLITDTLICGMLVMFVFFYLINFIVNSFLKSSFWAAITSLCSLVFVLSSTGLISSLFDHNAGTIITSFYKLEIIAIPWGGYALLSYLRKALNKENFGTLLKYMLIYNSVYTLGAFFVKSSVVSSFLILAHIPLLIALGASITITRISSKSKLLEAQIIETGFIIVAFTLVIDMTTNYVAPTVPAIFKFSIVFFLMALAFTTSLHYRKTYREIKKLSDSLKMEVETQTEEIAKKNTLLNEKIIEVESLLRVIIHDLANSMTIIGSCISMILKSLERGESGKIEKLTQKLSKAHRLQLDILNHVKEMEALDSNKLEVGQESVSLKECKDEIYFLFNDKLSLKGVALNFIGFDRGTNFIAEKHSVINSVFANIISNAIKFSNKGDSIRISAETTEQSLKITIEDQGVGIPQKIMENLFSRDKKTTRSGTSGEKGTGFGMPIVKKYMDLYHATIEVYSRDISEHPDNHGTTFELTFKSAEGLSLNEAG
jgi:signal transduction histidine kinase